MRIAVLGPVRIFDDDGQPIEIAGARLLMLLARLALSAGRVVPSEILIDDIWGSRSAGTPNTLHALVHRLRRALPAGTVESLAAGYRLAMPADSVDAYRFEALAARGRRELTAGNPEQASATLADALALWHGPAFADVLAAPYAGTAGARLAELRATAAEDRFEAELRLGRHAEALPDLGAACEAHPLRERLAALRMRALAAAGRQSDALAVYEAMKHRLADELGIDPSGELRQTQLTVLRGEVDHPAARPAPSRLPSWLTSFVGRTAELTLLRELMETARLITVIGPGGVGKTRLAVAAAAEHRTCRDGRLWLVPLAGVERPAGVVSAILGALSAGHGQHPGSAEPLERVAELIGGDEAVLLLDNCEQVVAEVARVAQRLLEVRPRLTVLATSREPLEVLGESLCRLGPLEIPSTDPDPGGLTESPAVRLFLDRAAAVRPDFTLDESTGPAIADVVRRLDGLPLALELAAARLRSMSIEQITRRLDDRFRLLSTGNRAAQPRQRTLRAVIEWSWELLTDRERVLARRLAYFPARTEAEVAEAICADEQLPPEEVGYVLGSLADKSLMEPRGDGYRMLESIRAFAFEELMRAGELTMIRQRFTRHFATLAAEYEPRLRSHGQASALNFLATEYDNLVFALRAALDGEDAEAAASLLGLLHWCWYTVRYDARAESFIAEILRFGAALPAPARVAFTALDALIGLNAPATDTDQVRAMIDDCSKTGALQRYPLLLTVTLPVAHQLGMDDLVAAEMADARRGPDPWARAYMSLLEARIAGDRADWPGFVRARERAVHEFAGTGDQLTMAVTLALRSQINTVRGENAAAIADLERANALAAGTGAQDEIAYLTCAAAIRMRTGDLDGAARDLELAEQLTRARGLRFMVGEVLRSRAEIARRAGDFEQARHMLAQLAQLRDQLPLPDLDRWLIPAWLTLRLTERDSTRARALLPAAIAAARANGEPATAAQQLARLLFLESDFSGAATALGMSEAIRGAFDSGDPELRELAVEVGGQLGDRDYGAAYRAGARLDRAEAIARLEALCDPALPTYTTPVSAV